MTNALEEAAAIAKAKAFRSRLVESVIESIDILRKNKVPECYDSTQAVCGILVMLSGDNYREVSKEVLEWPHQHVKIKVLNVMVDAIFVPEAIAPNGERSELRIFLVRDTA